jgi:metal-responsive CopG/Arc/MetJ family transcriptional regulator
MTSATAKNLHVPLPQKLYRALRAAAEREGRPATQLARAAIIDYLRAKRRQESEEELRAYVAEAAGTIDDLDEALEAASVEHLTPKKRRRR